VADLGHLVRRVGSPVETGAAGGDGAVDQRAGDDVVLDELDDFIEREIKPLERENIRFFDHRREWARTDFENDGLPQPEWEELLREMRRRADAAGHLRFALPKELGGQDGTNLAMAIIREHLAAKGLGLHNDLQNESSIVGNFPQIMMLRDFGAGAEGASSSRHDHRRQARRLRAHRAEPRLSDATWLETRGVRDGDDWVINGEKRFNTGMHHATHDMMFARTSGVPGDARGITCFIVPVDAGLASSSCGGPSTCRPTTPR
jgi:acyl-CoA dehydrogenase